MYSDASNENKKINKAMKKHVFYLKDESEFIQDFKEPDELIIWSYKWTIITGYDTIESKLYSKAFHELIELNYNEN